MALPKDGKLFEGDSAWRVPAGRLVAADLSGRGLELRVELVLPWWEPLEPPLTLTWQDRVEHDCLTGPRVPPARWRDTQMLTLEPMARWPAPRPYVRMASASFFGLFYGVEVTVSYRCQRCGAQASYDLNVEHSLAWFHLWWHEHYGP